MTAKKELPADVIDDKPQTVKADLRKFNKAQAAVDLAVTGLIKYTKIENDRDLGGIQEALKVASDAGNLIEKKRKDLGKPFKDAKEAIDKYAKDLVNKLPAAIAAAKTLIIGYSQKLEEQKKADRKRARISQLIAIGFVEAATENHYINGDHKVPFYVLDGFEDIAWQSHLSELVAKINQGAESEKQKKQEGAAFFGESAAIDEGAFNKIAIPAPTTSSNFPGSFSSGSSKVKGITKTWTFEVTDQSLVPREYLQVNETLIREEIAAGKRDISGINIFQKEGYSIK